MSSTRFRTTLFGRKTETESVQGVAKSARAGRSSVLVVTGDPGVGKTTLVAHSLQDSPAVNIVRIGGVERESSFPFAAVQRLVLSGKDSVDSLPEAQRRAILIATGLREGPPPAMGAVGLATLQLIAALGAKKPLLIWVDDAHWLDQESLSSLSFAARRLESEAVGLIFSLRPDSTATTALSGLPELRVTGLSGEDGQALLHQAMSVPIDRLVAERIVQATAGNPLAIIDLSRELSSQQLMDGALLVSPVPLGRRLELHYLQQASEFSPDAQLWLLLAASEATGDLEYITAAADHLGLDPASAHIGEKADLVSVEAVVEFRHPLVRSAIYNGSTATDRRRAHAALAAVMTRSKDADRRAWHLSSAEIGPNERVAALIVEVADQAGRRGGFATRATYLARAAELTEDDQLRTSRQLAAAEAAIAAGSVVQAQNLLDNMGDLEHDAANRGRALAVAAQLTAFSGVPGALGRVPAILFAAFQALAETNGERARDSLVRALEQAVIAESMMVGVSADALAAAAISAAAIHPDGIQSLVMMALATQFTAPYEEAAGHARSVIQALTSAQTSDDDLLRWGMTGVVAATFLWDETARSLILERAATAARNAGALQVLDSILWTTALCESTLGRVQAAEVAMNEVRELRIAVGATPEQMEVYSNAGIMALQGFDDELRSYVPRAVDAAEALGLGAGPPVNRAALMTLEISRCNYRAALTLAERIVADDALSVTIRILPDLIESAYRVGRPERAHEAVERFSKIAVAADTPWALGVLARTRALDPSADDTEQQFHAAISGLETTAATLDLARSHLLYGEWLRRNRRRQHARTQLRAAIALFDELHAHAFGERARAELLLTGEQVRKPPVSGAKGLTAQETVIVQLAISGATNAVIASRLFVSSNTVDYHLRKIYRKLGVTSRRDLDEAMHTART